MTTLMTVGTFGLFLLLFTLVGVASSRVAKPTTDDYLVAGRSVAPWLTALSSVATNNSGFMFVGLIGFTYRGGLHTIWMAVAWILGDLLVWLGVHQRVRQLSGELDVVSVPSLLGMDPQGTRQRAVVRVTAALTFVFLGGYAAAQLRAGSIALEELFGAPPWLGATLGAGIVVAYCFSGGLRASIWTDAAQAVVMLGSMALLLGFCVVDVGGPTTLLQLLGDQDPALLGLMPPDATLGMLPYLLGFVAGGFGAIGQPHILVRSMAITSAADIPRARLWYYAWFVPFYAAAIAVGLYARVAVPELLVPPAGLTGAAAQAAVTHATEGALPALAVAMLPPALVGVMLAGLFSATMSTADSQVLACSAAVTEDALEGRADRRLSKLATLAVTALALALALGASEGVFALVLAAWSYLGASLGPVLLVRIARQPLGQRTALAMIGCGLATIQLWKAFGPSGAVFALLPGILVPLALYGLARGAFGADAARQ